MVQHLKTNGGDIERAELELCHASTDTLKWSIVLNLHTFVVLKMNN